MPQTVVTGERATAAGQGIDQNSRVIDMSDVIHLLDPNEAPLTAITMKIRKVNAISPKVEWLEDDYLPTTDTIAGGITGLNTTFTANNGGYFRVGDVLKSLDTGEVMYVSAVSTNTITVSRGIGSTTATTIATGGVLLIIGNANNENSTRRTIKTTQKTPQFNYTQIWRWEFGISGTLDASQVYGGSDLAYQSKKAGKEHRIQMERSFLFGERNEFITGIGSSTPIRFCGGIIQKITTNITTATTLSAAVLEVFLRSAFRYGPASKMLFASRPIVSFITNIARASLRVGPSTESFPLSITEYVSPHGACYIVTHNLLDGSGGNNTAYSGWGLLLDLDSIFYRPLGGRDTRLKTNIQANDQDGRIDGYISEACPQLIQEQNHAILRNITDFL